MIEKEISVGAEGGIDCVDIPTTDDNIAELEQKQFLVSLEVGDAQTFVFSASPVTVEVIDNDVTCEAGKVFSLFKSC